ncbi:hypothetical protein HK414_10490 [Ramlibacter terrae]|uniref:Tripartite tricarboxylate transporter substrate binding protein n=1 Tax=Ramlibacter terrae TaxID=2732511 RepID=A0ABX6P4V1_9BURK|nr:hypothetical protein HK414_10490 [Ramlibacter terrae]
MKSTATLRAAAPVLAMALLPHVHARGYPAKAVRIVVPYATGGGSDILARRSAPACSSSGAGAWPSRTRRGRRATSARSKWCARSRTATRCCCRTAPW